MPIIMTSTKLLRLTFIREKEKNLICTCTTTKSFIIIILRINETVNIPELAVGVMRPSLMSVVCCFDDVLCGSSRSAKQKTKQFSNKVKAIENTTKTS